jgi:hypothetical protein
MIVLLCVTSNTVIIEHKTPIRKSRKPKGSKVNKPMIEFIKSRPRCIPNKKRIEPREKSEFFLEERKFKKNPLRENGIGLGYSGVLFDYLDPVFLKPIIEEFKEMYSEAQKMSEPVDFENRLSFIDYYITDTEIESQYNLKEIAKINSKSPSFLKAKRDEIEKQLANLWFTNLKVNDTQRRLKEWENSITAGQLQKIISSWHWEYEHITKNEDYATFIVKMYDFDGDGRLNAEEFLQAAIDLTTNYEGSKTRGCIHCFGDFKELILNPLFDNADSICENGVISAEEIWFTLKFLNRKDNSPDPNLNAEMFDMYKCEQSLYGNMRTNSINDFVLKSRNTEDGELLKHEFNTGILYGFLNRQVRGSDIRDDSLYNEINIRYAPFFNNSDHDNNSNNSYAYYCP